MYVHTPRWESATNTYQKIRIMKNAYHIILLPTSCADQPLIVMNIEKPNFHKNGHTNEDKKKKGFLKIDDLLE